MLPLVLFGTALAANDGISWDIMGFFGRQRIQCPRCGCSSDHPHKTVLRLINGKRTGRRERQSHARSVTGETTRASFRMREKRPRQFRCQPAYKPGSGWPEPCGPDVTAIPLGCLLPDTSSNQPGRPGLETGPHPLRGSIVPIRSCSRWGLPCRPCCQVRGALLPHLFTLTWKASRQPGRFNLCGAVPGVTPAGRYPAPYFRGARTFLPQLFR
jgi:hypothetical protein